RKNERNKQVSQQMTPSASNTNTPAISSWPRTATLTSLPPGAEIKRPDMPKIEEVSENDKSIVSPVISTNESVKVLPTPSLITLPTTIASGTTTTSVDIVTTAVLFSKPTVSISKVERLADPTSDASIQNESTSASAANETVLSVPSWRQGLRKTGSTSMVPEWMSENESNSLPRSASSPRLAQEALQERLASRRPLSSTGSVTTVTTSTMSTVSDKVGDRNSYTFGQNYTGLRTNSTARLGNYISSFQSRQHKETNANSDEKQGPSNLGHLRDRSSITGVTSTVTSPLPNLATTSTTSSSITNINSLSRRSYEPPKRDEETETQRKARAKHARQTRRSTQGVSLEDIEKAEEVLRLHDPLNPGSSSASLSLSTSKNLLGTTDGKAVGNGTGQFVSTTGSSGTVASISSSAGDNPLKEDSSVISGYRSRTTDDKNDAVDSPAIRSFRRAREDRDLTSSLSTSTDITSNYIPRSQRNSVNLSSEPSSSVSSSQSLLRSSSVRSNRLRNCETDLTPKSEEELRNDDSSQEKKEKDEKKESSSIRSRRQRRERRSTGIVYDNEDGEVSKENRPEEDKTDVNLEQYSDGIPFYLMLSARKTYSPRDGCRVGPAIMSYGSHRYGAVGGGYSTSTGLGSTAPYNIGNGYGSGSGGTNYQSGGLYPGSYGTSYTGGSSAPYSGSVGNYSLHAHSPSPYSCAIPPSTNYTSGLASSVYGSGIGSSSSYTPSSPSPYVPGTSKSLASASPSPYIPGSGRLGSGSSLSSSALSSPYYSGGSSGIPISGTNSVLGLPPLSSSIAPPPTPSASSLSGPGLGSTSSLSGRASSSGHGSAYSSRSNSTTSLPGSSSFGASGLSASLGNLGSSKYSSFLVQIFDVPSSERSQRPNFLFRFLQDKNILRKKKKISEMEEELKNWGYFIENGSHSSIILFLELSYFQIIPMIKLRNKNISLKEGWKQAPPHPPAAGLSGPGLGSTSSISGHEHPASEHRSAYSSRSNSTYFPTGLIILWRFWTQCIIRAPLLFIDSKDAHSQHDSFPIQNYLLRNNNKPRKINDLLSLALCKISDLSSEPELVNLGSSKYSSRFSSNSDVPSSERSQRPTSYSDFSRSTGSLDLDYKKKYEEEKSENEKLRKELEETKKSLLEAKAELDKVLKQREKEQPRNSDRDKRTLERKISEMEEELKKMEALKTDNQRLKDENGALIRVISKLSK
ncbi:hypothetical protein Btru_016436, partial [Bulinus truncatus]